MDLNSQTTKTPITTHGLQPSFLNKFFDNKRNILIVVIVLFVLIVGYFIYKKYSMQPETKVLTEEQKQQILEDIERDSEKTNSMFDYQKSYKVLDSIGKSSINSPARRMSEEQKIKLLESLNK